MSGPPFRRIAIVNRGEAAMRLINAVKELQDPVSGWPLAVALHTEAESSAMFVREADEAVQLAPGEGNRYLDYDALQRALVDSNADAAWVGWGFVAEHPQFAALCERLDIVFIGPSAEVMERLGDKIGAKLLAEESGVPVAAWSGGPVPDLDAAREAAERIGYPLMIKAAAGGGGRGIRRVDAEEELAPAFERATEEARRSFGDATVFMERVVSDARHVEVQIAADHHGHVWALGVRDCSLQRRNQKVIEESASTALNSSQEALLRDAAVALARAAEYRNVGTVEFLYQPETGDFAFLEVNTRLQVEHTVTEVTTHTDLVQLQIEIAGGAELGGRIPPVQGHAIEARLNAEDPAQGFAPAPGRIELLEFPTGPGVRVDTGVAEGDVIPPNYDAMIAKIIAWGPTRDDALRRLRRALNQTRVVIAGGTTNKSFLLGLLAREEVAAGQFTTSWLDGLTATGDHLSSAHGAVALIGAAIDALRADAALDQTAFFASAIRGRPQIGSSDTGRFSGRTGGEAYDVTIEQISPDRYTVTLDGDTAHVTVLSEGRSGRLLSVAGQRHRVLSSIDGVDHLVEVDGHMHRISRDDGGTLRAPAPALVVAVPVSVGDVVRRGTPVAVLEAMKVETAVLAPFDATVVDVLARANTQVDAGEPLVRLQAAETEQDTPGADGGGRLSLAPLRSWSPEDTVSAEEAALDALDLLRWQVAGFTRDDATTRALLDRYTYARSLVDSDDADVLHAELAILDAFADISTLSRNRRATDDDLDAGSGAHNPQEWFHRWLRSLDVDAEGLPADFETKLRKVLEHFQIVSLDRTPALERAAFAVFCSQQRADDHAAIVLAILNAMAGALDAPDLGPHATRVRGALDHLVGATQVRFPAIGERARRLRFALHDQPFIESARETERARVREHLSYLRSWPQAEDRSEHIRAMVASPARLMEFFEDQAVVGDHADRDLAADVARVPGDHTALLEVITRRNYQTKSLDRFRVGRAAGRLVLTVSHRENGTRQHILATAAPAGELRDVLASVSEIAAKAPADDDLVVDLYLDSLLDTSTPDDLALAVDVHLRDGFLTESVSRLTVSGWHPSGSVRHITMRNVDGAFVEDRKIRGLHPSIADRLQLWRFEHFDVERLDSADDSYMFHAVSRTDENDRRLFSAAEVRDFTPVRDADGAITALPELEAQLMACLGNLAQAQRSVAPADRPQWNRVLLYIWPEVDIPLEDLDAMARSIAPATVGLGLEDVRVQARLVNAEGHADEVVVRITNEPGGGLDLAVVDVPDAPLEPVDAYTRKVQSARRRGTPYPYELLELVTGADGSFIEYDIDAQGAFGPVERARGLNTAGVVVGLVSTPTPRHPEGITRVAVFGDPTKGLGSIGEPECRRILAAIELAEMIDVPVEWFALSSGARIAMDSGTENMDWISRVLRRIVEVTQAGREINIVVAGINVGAQPYWNAEATMLMHSRGILIMTPQSAMVLTGKEALDVSGGVSAEDNFGIGGHDRIMGPNGQAQYWAPDLRGACELLFRHYELTWVAPGERYPRPLPTNDRDDRDPGAAAHDMADSDLATVAEIFSDETNPDRKKPFDIRTVMNATIDQDIAPLERWAHMRDAHGVVVYDAAMGGHPVTLLGIESRPLPRFGLLPADGPEQWSAGTLFPLSSKKAARAINAASGNRPLVVLANLSGFDGSPESLGKLQLEYGAEIGRAVVNFDGPIVFCVISRYHGGAFVVFSRTLNDNMTVLAVQGTKASVLGGAPAAAVVFAREVNRRTDADPRVTELRETAAASVGRDATAMAAELAAVREEVHSEKLGEVADEFDSIHSIERARDVGSIDAIIAPSELRSEVIAAVRAGMAGSPRRRQPVTIPGAALPDTSTVADATVADFFFADDDAVAGSEDAPDAMTAAFPSATEPSPSVPEAAPLIASAAVPRPTPVAAAPVADPADTVDELFVDLGDVAPQTVAQPAPVDAMPAPVSGEEAPPPPPLRLPPPPVDQLSVTEAAAVAATEPAAIEADEAPRWTSLTDAVSSVISGTAQASGASPEFVLPGSKQIQPRSAPKDPGRFRDMGSLTSLLQNGADGSPELPVSPGGPAIEPVADPLEVAVSGGFPDPVVIPADSDPAPGQTPTPTASALPDPNPAPVVDPAPAVHPVPAVDPAPAVDPVPAVDLAPPPPPAPAPPATPAAVPATPVPMDWPDAAPVPGFVTPPELDLRADRPVIVPEMKLPEPTVRLPDTGDHAPLAGAAADVAPAAPPLTAAPPAPLPHSSAASPTASAAPLAALGAGDDRWVPDWSLSQAPVKTPLPQPKWREDAADSAPAGPTSPAVRPLPAPVPLEGLSDGLPQPVVVPGAAPAPDPARFPAAPPAGLPAPPPESAMGSGSPLPVSPLHVDPPGDHGTLSPEAQRFKNLLDQGAGDATTAAAPSIGGVSATAGDGFPDPVPVPAPAAGSGGPPAPPVAKRTEGTGRLDTPGGDDDDPVAAWVNLGR